MLDLYKQMIEWTLEYSSNESYPCDNEMCYYVNPKKFKVKEHYRYDRYRESKFLSDKHKFSKLKDIPHDAEVYYYKTFNHSGNSGGNCWGDNAHYYSNDIPINFNFDDFALHLCEKFCPSISFIDYSLLLGKCIIHDSYEIYEYYGNMSNYRLIAFDLRKFAEGVEKYVNNNTTNSTNHISN